MNTECIVTLYLLMLSFTIRHVVITYSDNLLNLLVVLPPNILWTRITGGKPTLFVPTCKSTTIIPWTRLTGGQPLSILLACSSIHHYYMD